MPTIPLSCAYVARKQITTPDRGTTRPDSTQRPAPRAQPVVNQLLKSAMKVPKEIRPIPNSASIANAFIQISGGTLGTRGDAVSRFSITLQVDGIVSSGTHVSSFGPGSLWPGSVRPGPAKNRLLNIHRQTSARTGRHGGPYPVDARTSSQLSARVRPNKQL